MESLNPGPFDLDQVQDVPAGASLYAGAMSNNGWGGAASVPSEIFVTFFNYCMCFAQELRSSEEENK